MRVYGRALALLAITAAVCAALGPSSGMAEPGSSGSAPQTWDCIADQAQLVGLWELKIDGGFSELVFSRSLYPGHQPTRLVLKNPSLSGGGGMITFRSDQAELEIYPDKPAASACPVYGASCSRARLSKISLPEIGPVTSRELRHSAWACTPSSGQ